MAITYVNDLRLSEMGTGDNSGTWGTVTNTNLELIGEALGFGTEAITTNADTHASTIADGSTDPVRAMYVKYTGTLDSACTITIGPNTVNKFYYIENATSGSQNIIISQGSGANVTIPPGDVKAVYLDGAGSGAAVTDAFASLNVVDLKVQDDLTVTDDATIGGRVIIDDTTDATSTTDGSLQTDGGLSVAKDAIIGNDLKLLSDGGELVSGADGDFKFYHNGSNAFIKNTTGDLNIENNADIYIDSTHDIILDADGEDIRFKDNGVQTFVFTMGAGSTVATPRGNLTFDVAGELVLDVDSQGSGNGILLKDDGTHYASIFRSESHLHIKAETSDKEIRFLVNDGGAEKTPMILSGSDSGQLVLGNLGGNALAEIIGSSGAGSTNQPGSDLLLKGGVGGGTGGSKVRIFTAPGGSSGTSASNPVERLTVSEGGQTTLTLTSAGASTTPFVIHNASSNANTDVRMLLAPCTTAADRPVILSAVNNGSNVVDFGISTPNGGTPIQRITVAGSDGDMSLLTGNLVVGTAGKGIDFSAQTASSGATGELLDHYEEGTYDAVLTPGSGSFVLDLNALSYTIIGRNVYINGRVHVSAANSPSGNTFISLPIASGTQTPDSGDYNSMMAHTYGVNLPDDTIQTFWEISPGGSTALLLAVKDNAVWENINANNIAAGDIIYVSGHYVAA